jgi:predicted DNA-binding transcriptional regulator AlpA
LEEQVTDEEVAVNARTPNVGPRRCLRRDGAAGYVGVSASKFDQLVEDGRMPQPFRIDGCVLWDIRRLDLAIDALVDDVAPEEQWADV